MACHWPGIYFNGEEVGFKIFQEVVSRLHSAYDNLIWMKLSEIARYWAARELTQIDRPEPAQIAFQAPFSCPDFTLKITLAHDLTLPPLLHTHITTAGKKIPLSPVANPRQLKSGEFHRLDRTLVVCFDLPKGVSRLSLD